MNPSDTAPTLNELQRLAAICQFFLDPKARAKQIEELSAMMIAAEARIAAAEQAEASLAQAKAEHDKRETAIREQEFELHTKSQLVEGRHRELSSYARHLGEIEDQIKIRLLRHVGALEYYNPTIQRLPEWAAVDRELGISDAHYDGNEGTPRDHGTGATEPPENLIQGSTLTRASQDKAARKSMRRGVEN
jgi:hypothetical protein